MYRDLCCLPGKGHLQGPCTPVDRNICVADGCLQMNVCLQSQGPKRREHSSMGSDSLKLQPRKGAKNCLLIFLLISVFHSFPLQNPQSVWRNSSVYHLNVLPPPSPTATLDKPGPRDVSDQIFTHSEGEGVGLFCFQPGPDVLCELRQAPSPALSPW